MGGLFGKSKTTTTVPDWVREPIMDNVAAARNVAAMGYTPYYGPDVAAFTPMQQASFQNTNDAMSAFGMAAPTDPMAGMPQAQTFAGGVQGYSSAPMYQAAVDQLRMRNPAQYQAIMSMMDTFQQQAQPAQAVARNPMDPANATSLAEYIQLGGDLSKIRPGMFSSGGGGGGAPAGAPHSGGAVGGLLSGRVAASLPGGVNTANPSSFVNQTVGRMTSSNSKPTAGDRPRSNPRR